jgi:hypothetical protein
METFGNKIVAKSCAIFYCKKCDYGTSRKSSYNKHCDSIKHKKGDLETSGNISDAKSCAKTLTCENCEKTFKNRSGLWKHNKKCTDMIIDGINIKNKDALVLHLLKQNGDLQNKLIELSSEKSITNNTTNNNINNTTNNNTSFNLNFFLNETCKDAMNITDFVSSIKLSLEDLENTGKQGYIKGISDIIVKNLNNLEQCFRPIHCSDMKREVFYIKENNKWEKETEDNPILTKTIKLVANENIKQIKYWRDKNPDCTDSNSKKNNLYLKIVSNSMNGLTKEEGEKNINKIISNVAKEVVINKVSFQIN